MIGYFAYTRVSTVKQGEGASLSEQKMLIAEYAEKHSLPITRWFEETDTAAKRGRKAYRQVLSLLERKQARGLIVHKIDRSARNLRDWADLGELIDQGIDVRFAHDNFDLDSRGGRLAADIQAVIAADYIRNLRDEVKKGIDGRLRQGLFPGCAPIGYQNRGSGRVKVPDPIMAPLITEAFELYASGEWSMRQIASALGPRGLRSRTGKPVAVNNVTRILRNPFYAGIIKMGAREEVAGIHQPLITRALYDQVALRLEKKLPPRRASHRFTYQLRMRCICGRFAIGELAKGRYIYYRCHGLGCRGTIVREHVVDEAVGTALANLALPPEVELDTILGPLHHRWQQLFINEQSRNHRGREPRPWLLAALEHTNSSRAFADDRCAAFKALLARPAALYQMAPRACREELLKLAQVELQISGKTVFASLKVRTS